MDWMTWGLPVALALAILIVVWTDGYGNALGHEQDLRVYELNERLRAEEGSTPVRWPGSMDKYNEAVRSADRLQQIREVNRGR